MPHCLCSLHVRQRKTQQHHHTHIKEIYLLCTIHHHLFSLSLSPIYLESQCLVNIHDDEDDDDDEGSDEVTPILSWKYQQGKLWQFNGLTIIY